ncbi:MAG: pilus assembly protein N-terminal domain-containing protein [Planctomycetota bacterium]
MVPASREARTPRTSRFVVRRRVAVGVAIVGALSLGAAPMVPHAPVPAAPEAEANEPLATGFLAQDGDVVGLTKGTHRELTFNRPIQRIAIGDAAIVEQQTLSDREVLLRGLAVGRTSLIVWYTDGTHEQKTIWVKKDLELLEAALTEIHPSITVDIAPDREAYVLRGLVANMNMRRAAEQAAEAYLNAGRAPVLVGGEGVTTEAVVTEARGNAGSIINLIRVEELGPELDQRVQVALATAGYEGVLVRRVQYGDLPDETRDLIVLEGEVHDQIALTRALTLVGRLVEGEDSSIEVLADEAGAWRDRIGNLSTSGNGSSSGFGTGGSSSFNVGRLRLDNQVEANLARASVLSTANGRVISFVEVTDLPQVRVQVEFYEVDRNGLREVRPKLAAAISDFQADGVSRSPLTTQFQGTPTGNPDAPFSGGFGTGPTSETDVQNVVNFLDGTFANEVQLSTGRLALSATLRFLEEQGLARSLSRPSLTVLSGESAQFLVGGEIPVRQSAVSDASGGVITTSTTTESFGIGLAVRPLVGRDGRITLDVQPEVTEPDFDLTADVVAATGTAQETVGFRTRTLRTSARLDDGQALLVGGLKTRRHDGVKRKMPLLGDVPLVGWLFRDTSEQSEQTELVIVVTPVVLRQPEARALLWPYGDPFEALLDAVPPPEDRRARDEEVADPAAREAEGSGQPAAAPLPEPVARVR